MSILRSFATAMAMAIAVAFLVASCPAARANQSLAAGCPLRSTPSTIFGHSFELPIPSPNEFTINDYGGQPGSYSTFSNPFSGITYSIDSTALYYMDFQTENYVFLTFVSEGSTLPYPQNGTYTGSHAPQTIFNATSGAIVVWDADNVLRDVSLTVQEPAFDVPNYYNNAYSYVSPSLIACNPSDFYYFHEIVNPPNNFFLAVSGCCSDMETGDFAQNNGIYAIDGYRYFSNKVLPSGAPDRTYSWLPDAWTGVVATANFGNFMGNYMEPGSSFTALNYPPTAAMLTQVAEEYCQGGIDLSKIPSKQVWMPQSFRFSDVEIPDTSEYTNVQHQNVGAPVDFPFFYQWIYNEIVSYSPFYAFESVSSGDAVLWLVNGTGTALCDPAQIASNPLIAQAPHAMDGVFCASLGTAPAPGGPACGVTPLIQPPSCVGPSCLPTPECDGVSCVPVPTCIGGACSSATPTPPTPASGCSGTSCQSSTSSGSGSLGLTSIGPAGYIAGSVTVKDSGHPSLVLKNGSDLGASAGRGQADSSTSLPVTGQ